MKIGIITFHCSYNYGSAIQAYALQEYLCQNGHEAKIIHFISLDFDNYRLLHLKNGLKRLAKDIILLPLNLKIRKSFRRFWKEYFDLTTKYGISSDMSDLNHHFDAFVCGSDQIWNLDCTKGIIPQFFLSFSKKKSIAYAPSLAHTVFTTQFNEDELKRLLDNLYAISVREKDTIGLIKQYTSKPVSVVVDPTLLLDAKHYEKMCTTREEISNKYIFFYMLEYNEEMIKYARELSEKKGLDVIYFSKRPIVKTRTWKNEYGASPNEWLTYIKDAEYIVCNSFHATVFSILFRKQFKVFITRKSGARMKGLLEALDLEERIYSSKNTMEEPIEYNHVENLLKDYVVESKEYLKHCLEE